MQEDDEWCSHQQPQQHHQFGVGTCKCNLMTSSSPDQIIERASTALEVLLVEHSVPPSHGLLHARRVLNHTQCALDSSSTGVQQNDYTTRTVLLLAALLHDADDHKYFGKGSSNARRIIKHALQRHAHTARIEADALAVIALVSTTANGNGVPDGVDPLWLYPRWADRLEAIGEVGVVRCHQYNQEVRRPLYTSTTPQPKSMDEVLRAATDERFRQYQHSKVDTAALAREKEAAEQERVRALDTVMGVAVPCEVDGERRVAVAPINCKRLRQQGFQVYVQRGAGAAASYRDVDYERWGAIIVDTVADLWHRADLMLKVNSLTVAEAEQVPAAAAAVDDDDDDAKDDDASSSGSSGRRRRDRVVISFFDPRDKDDDTKGVLEVLKTRGATLLGMQLVPRITRAQKLDALSSTANIAGYRAVIEAANEFGRFFTGQITAAGKVPPAKVLVIGAGVAGLAAIGAAKALGGVVRAFDVRPVVKEEVESMGAEFLMLDFHEDGAGEGGYANIMSKDFYDAEMTLFAREAPDMDIIITTAQIPGRTAPRLIMRYMVDAMRPGSVIVDMAAASGGNCEATVAGVKHVTDNGVVVLGYTDLASRMARLSSQLYGSNLCHLLDDMGKAAGFAVDEDDVVVRSMLVLNGGEMKWPPPRPAQPAAAAATTTTAGNDEEKDDGKRKSLKRQMTADDIALKYRPPPSPEAVFAGKVLRAFLWFLAYTGMIIGVGIVSPALFHSNEVTFVLSCVLGYFLVWNVTPALHTPLMSVTNAISGIVIISAMQTIGVSLGDHQGSAKFAASFLGFLATMVSAVNVAGGFVVTHRMLMMFKR